MRAKWSKRRLKDVSKDQKSTLDFGLNHGIGDEIRGFRWTKRRMKKDFECVKFGQDTRKLEQSRTIAVFRGAGGVDRKRKKERKKEIGPEFDCGMVKWAEERMAKWLECRARMITNRRMERADPGTKRGNSKFDRGREQLALGLKARDIRYTIMDDFWFPRSEGSCSWFTAKRPFG